MRSRFGGLAGMTVAVALLAAASGCQRAEEVDPELGRQTVLTGSVTLADGEEPSNVSVVARLRDEAAVTDSASTGVDGRFRMVGLPPGEYDVDATKESYFTATKFVQLNEGLVSELDFELELKPTGVPFSIVYISGGSNDGDPEQTGAVATRLAGPFVVEVRDSAAEPLSDVQVIFQILEDRDGGQMEVAGWMSTDVDGQVRNHYVLGRRVGRNRIRVQALGLQEEHVDFTARGVPGPARTIVLESGADQAALAGQTLADPIAVRIEDAHANPVPDMAVRFSPADDGQTDPALTTSDEAGRAQTSWTLGTDACPGAVEQTLTVTAGDAEALLVEADIDHGPADRLVIASGNNQTTRLGLAAPEPLVVRLEDGYGNPVDQEGVEWTVIAGLCDLSPPANQVQLTDSHGLVAVGALPRDTAADESLVEIQAAAGALDAVTFTIAIISGEPAALRATGGQNQWGAIGETLSDPLVFRLVDAESQPVAGAFVHFAAGADHGEWEWLVIDCAAIQPGADYHGQDGHYHSVHNQPAFTVHGDGTVTDGLTQLMWTRCAAGQDPIGCSGSPDFLDHAEAVAYCQGLELAGHDDWFLPTIVELQHIADYGQQHYAIDSTVFPNVPEEGFWSATIGQEEPDNLAFRWTLMQGRTATHDRGLGDGVVRCVRNRRPPPPNRFLRSEPQPDEPVVTDGSSGLIWQGCPAGSRGFACDQGDRESVLWADALAYCEGLQWAGHDDWCLPQIKALLTIVDFDRYWPAMDPEIFPGTGTG